MLEGVVKEYYRCILGTFVAGKAFYSLTTIGINGNVDVGKLLVYLVRLVADVTHGSGSVGKYITLALALIPTTEDSHLHIWREQTHEILHVRRLSRSANGNITHTDYRNAERSAFQHPSIEKVVTETHHQSV